MTVFLRFSPLLLASAAAAWTGVAFSQDGLLPWLVLMVPPLVLAVLHRPAWGLWVLLVTLPYTAVEGTGFRVGNFLIPALILGAWLLHRARAPRPMTPLPGGLAAWLAVFTAWVIFTAFFSRFPDRGVGVGLRYLVLLAVLLAFANLWSTRDLRRGLLAHALALVPVAAIAVWQLAVLGLDGLLLSRALSPERLSSIYVDPNTLGVVLGHGTIILAAVFFAGIARPAGAGRVAASLCLVPVLLLLIAGILVSFSRSSWVYVTAGVLTLALTHRRLRYGVLAAVAVAAVAFLVLPPPAWLQTGLRLGSGMSFRTSLWSAGWKMMADHPLTGVGAGAEVFEFHRAAYIPTRVVPELLSARGGSAHNVFLAKGAELGVVGFVLAVVLFVMLWTRVPGALRDHRRGDWLRGAAAAGVVGLTFRAFFETGTTLGLGHGTDSLNFFLFAMILLAPAHTSSRPWLLVPSERIREGRTGGLRIWAELVDRWTARGLPVVSEDQAMPPAFLRDRPHLMAIRHLLAFGGMRRGVVMADQSDAGRLGLLLRRLRMRTGVRIVVVVHHLRDSFRFRWGAYVRAARWNETAVLRLADRIVVHTREEAARVAERGIDPERITLIPLGRRKGGPPAPVRVLDEEEPLRLLWVGGDFERKGLDVLLDAVAGLSPRPRLVVVGRPDDDRIAIRARARAERLGLSGDVEFAGQVSEETLDRLWSSCDAFVMPSRHEGHGLALDEALARGLPVVASDLPVFRERLAGDEVLFVPVGDADRLAGALAAMREPDLRARLARAGLSRAATFPDWESTLTAYEAVADEEMARVAGRAVSGGGDA